MEGPWMKGPLLCFSKDTFPPGMVIFEPYLYVTESYGHYNGNWRNVSHPAFWVTAMNPYLAVGVTNWLDVFCLPSWGYNRNQGVGNWFWGDFPAGIDIQLFRGHVDDPYPSVKLFIQESFPTGKFDRLDPAKQGTDAGGVGSFVTSAGLVIGKLIHFTGPYWLNIALDCGYFMPAKSHIRGFNAFGASKHTNGTLYLGPYSQFDLGAVLTLSQRWALACDFIADYYQKTKFTAKNPAGYYDSSHQRKFSTVIGSITQYAIAPAIQYNWSQNQGVMSGVWFTLAGRNTEAFLSWVSAVAFVF